MAGALAVALASVLAARWSSPELGSPDLDQGNSTGGGGADAARYAPPPAVLTADRTVHDFGHAIQGAKLPAEFRLRNTARVPVAITDVINSCDCADLDLSSRLIEPGAEARLSVRWDIGPRRGQTQAQLVLVSARQAGERASPDAPLPVEPRHDYLELTLSADVEPDFDYDPRRLEFTAGQPSTQVVRFSPHRVAAVRLVAAYAAHAAFSARVLSGEREVEVAFDPALWTDGELSELVVLSSCAGEPQCRIALEVAGSPVARASLTGGR